MQNIEIVIGNRNGSQGDGNVMIHVSSYVFVLDGICMAVEIHKGDFESVVIIEMATVTVLERAMAMVMEMVKVLL